MTNQMFRSFVFRLVSVALFGLGFVQVSQAGMIGTQSLIEQQAGEARTAGIDLLLARQDVADRLAALGVDAAEIRERAASLSAAELAMFEERLDAQVAGGNALGIIGAVFLVLLILELVGVTDVFKKL